jgi:hypothetical protein
VFIENGLLTSGQATVWPGLEIPAPPGMRQGPGFVSLSIFLSERFAFG